MKLLLDNQNHILAAAAILAVLLAFFWPRNTGAAPKGTKALQSITTIIGLFVFVLIMVMGRRQDSEASATKQAETARLSGLESSLSDAGIREASLRERLGVLSENASTSQKSCAALTANLCKALRDAAEKIGRYEVLNDGTISIQLKEPYITFQTGSADLSCEDREHLSRLAGILSLPLALNSIQSIDIVGHTDNRGSIPYNDELSLKRAQSVQRYLSSTGVVVTMGVEGRGERQPFPNLKHADADAKTIENRNATDELKAQNRRVEVLIIKQPGKQSVLGCSDTGTRVGDAGQGEARQTK